MPDIMSLFACLSQCLEATTRRQLCRVTAALLSMTGRVTMRGIARWTDKGGSDRTVQRVFTPAMNWVTSQWVRIRHHLWDPDEVILAAGDHVVVTKAGQQTYGWERFFSSLSGKAVPGLCFLTLSLMSFKRRTSSPALSEQVEKAPVTQKQPKKQSVGQRGRPKGRKNRHRRDGEWSPSLRFMHAHLARLLQHIGEHLKVVYCLCDGELGPNDAIHMVRQLGRHLVSKWRYHAALSVPYEGPYAGRDPRRKYGKKLDYRHLPAEHWQVTSIEEGLKTQIDQMSLWHKTFADLLNMVVLVKTHLQTHKTAHVVLCSSDVTWGSARLIDYDRWRFQLEFNFRDAKQ